jgi:hypothetical protein
VDVGNKDLEENVVRSCPGAVCVTNVDYLYFAISSLLVTRFHPSLVWGVNLLAPELFFLILAHPVYKT